MSEAILVATVDGEARPHAAMLSYGEVLAVDARTLRIAVYRESITAQNIRERGVVTLCLIAPGSAFYLKARTRELLWGDALAGFEATLEEVLADEARADMEGTATITSGIGFRVAEAESRLAAWSAQLAALRTAEVARR